MQKIKEESGITLVVLVITIIVLTLISVPVIIKTAEVSETQRYSDFIGDIRRLNESISQLYNLDSDLSQIGPVYNAERKFIEQRNSNDNSVYYIIDCDKLSTDLKDKFNIEFKKLEFGNNNYDIDRSNLKTTDVYIINQQSRTIYYSEGIIYKDMRIYRMPEHYTSISVEKDETPPTTNIISMENSPDHLFAIKAKVVIDDELSFLDTAKCKYEFSEDDTEFGIDESLYTDGTIDSTGIIEKVKEPGIYYLHVLATDINGNSSETISTNSVTVAEVADYSYTGNVQTASLLPGTYKLEVWGASGNTPTSLTANQFGYGGYSVGDLQLQNAQNLFICVGGQGQSGIATIATGGYNGGGSGKDWSDGRGAGGGGGATHIATISGTLSDIGYTNAITNNKLLIVAGGGGGVGDHTGLFDTTICKAGSGGGCTGGQGDSSYGDCYYIGSGGTQTAAGEFLTNNPNPSLSDYYGSAAGFGYGSSYGSSTGNVSGGGGGLYGGAFCVNYSGAGGGGSGYLSPLLTNKHMAGYNVTESSNPNTLTTKLTNVNTQVSTTAEVDKAKKGDGYARITNMN